MTLTQIKPAGLSKPVDLADNEKIRLGTGNDLQIYHSGADSFISDTGSGNLFITTGGLRVRNAANNENTIQADENGAVRLYYDDSKKFETISSGAKVLGDFLFRNTSDATQMFFDAGNSKLHVYDNSKITFGNTDDIQIYHDGSNSYIDNHQGDLYIRGEDDNIILQAVDGENAVKCNPNGSVHLYYDGNDKANTYANGFQITGNCDINGGALYLEDNQKANFGYGNDLQIYHDGSNSVIGDVGTGALVIKSNQIDFIDSTSTEFLGRFFQNSSVELYYDNSKRIATSTTGISVTRQNAGEYFNVNANYGSSGDQAIECSGDLTFYTNGSSIAARLDQDGLKFNADTAAANALDDYEEGTFTPTMTYNTLQSAPSGSFTGQYQKVGNCVHFQARFALTDEGSGINNIRLTNLPFTPSTSGFTHPMATFFAIRGVNIGDGDKMIVAQMETSSYVFYTVGIGDSDNYDAFHMNHTTDDAIFGCYGHYYTSS